VKRPLAIVGASTRSAAASAVRAGFQPLAADLFADADLRAIATATRVSPYPEGLLDWLRAVEPPAWMYTGALENYPELVDQMAWIAPLWGNPGDVLHRVRSPRELAHVLREAGLLFPEICDSPKGLPTDGSWLVKTGRSASGIGVREWRGQELSDFDVSERCFQRRSGGVTNAAIYVAFEGSATLLGVTQQLNGDAATFFLTWAISKNPFQYQGSIGPWPVSTEEHATLVKLGNVLATEFELVGLFGVDYIRHVDNSLWVLEVNPRYTASVEIVERFSGVDAIAAHAAACSGNQPQLDAPPILTGPWIPGGKEMVHGKAILIAPRDLTISERFAERALKEALQDSRPTIADVPSAGTRIEAGHPIATIFVQGFTGAHVLDNLRLRITELKSELHSES
jgi:predicted ATP-grasp superfamily ATP-dependent carboligase